MQTPFITDIHAHVVPPSASGQSLGAVKLRFQDEAGRHVGTAVVCPSDLAEQARALLALAEAATLHAVAAAGHALPPRHHFPLMRDVRVAEAA